MTKFSQMIFNINSPGGCFTDDTPPAVAEIATPCVGLGCRDLMSNISTSSLCPEARRLCVRPGFPGCINNAILSQTIYRGKNNAHFSHTLIRGDRNYHYLCGLKG